MSALMWRSPRRSIFKVPNKSFVYVCRLFSVVRLGKDDSGFCIADKIRCFVIKSLIGKIDFHGRNRTYAAILNQL